MRVLLFVKYPQPGFVKTRLAADIGKQHAAGLYAAFVHDELATLRHIGATPIICYAPEWPEAAYRQWLGAHEYLPQRGRDLGERMLTALRLALASSRRVLLIGSDLPDLPGSLIQSAYEALRTTALCLGPACDGGFYLIGAQREGLLPDLFDGVRWSTNNVLERVLVNCARSGIKPFLAPPWSDVDTLEDLHALTNKSSAPIHTLTYLQNHHLEFPWKR